MAPRESLQGSHRYDFIPKIGKAPLEVARAEGAYLYTPDGRSILDAAGGAIVANIGYGRSEVAQAYARAVEELTYLIPPFVSPSRVRLTERLLDRWAPAGLTRVGFTSGGSEAVETALRLARQHHVAAGRGERYKVIGRQLSYHGTTFATLSVGGHEPRRAGFEPLLHPFPKAPACYCLRCPQEKTYPECDVDCAQELERILDREGPDTVAAFIAEPVVGSNAGALVPPDEYLPRIAEICRRHQVLLIADEVMTGFGRTGRRFAVDHWGVCPDILVGGKGLTGGYAPMGLVLTTEEVVAPIAEAGEELMFFTYGAHPPSCAAADKVLEILEREGLVERAAVMGQRLLDELRRLESHPHVAQVRGRGLLCAVELVADRETLRPFPRSAGILNKVTAAGLSEGVLFYPGGNAPLPDVCVLGPPFTIGDEEIEKIVTTLARAIDSAVERVAAEPVTPA